MTVIALQNVTEYQGKSTDTKPINVRAGSRFHEIDTARTYYFNGSDWIGQFRDYSGTSTETKPTANVVKGSVYQEIDTSRAYLFNGTSWTRQYDLSRVGAQSRITFAVSTDVVSYTTSFSAYGKALTGYLAEVATNGNTSQIRTFTLASSNSVTLWSTTLACLTDTGITTGLGNSTVYTMTPNIPVDGTYTISLAISTNTTMPTLTDAITFFFQA